MRRFDPDAVIPEDARGAAIALGNFDGVHLGHQAVIAETRNIASGRGLPLAAAAFEPHPRALFQPDAPPFRLQTRDQRARALAALGVELLYKIRFDRALSQMTDFEFCEHVFARRLGAKHVTVGFDFRFGRGRMGDAESLARHGQTLGFGVSVIAAVDDGAGGKVSSSEIRAAIGRGDMREATRLLTRPWTIEGVVERGFARGRDIGLPTANVALGEYVRPRLGVYAVRVDVGDGLWRPGAASIGVNPTIGARTEPLLEVHLLDYAGDLYGARIEVQLIAFLRDEAKFDGVDAMMLQIAQDLAEARRILS